MQHTFEFIAKIKDGRTVQMYYTGKSSRHSKVTEKILQDLQAAYQIHPEQVEDLFLKPLKRGK
jgi:hypothetical protein